MGPVFLQGGVELTEACQPMDRVLLEQAGPGPVVVLPLAASPGSDYSGAAGRARSYFATLSAEVVVPEDPRRGPGPTEVALADVHRAGAIVLPGGSPRRLRDSLLATGLGAALLERCRAGVPFMGSSAGAMVAGEVTLLPAWRGAPESGPGLGLVPGLVMVPHYGGAQGARSVWVRVALAAGGRALGLPECSGVYLSAAGEMRSIGREDSRLLTAAGPEPVPR